MKRRRKMLIIAFLSLILFVSVSYSLFSSSFDFNGTSEIVGEWNVGITNVTVKSSNNSELTDIPKYDNNSVTFEAKLNKPGDEIIYEITVSNTGTIDAILDKFVFNEEENGSEAIKYEVSSIANNLKAGTNTTFTVKIFYDKDVTKLPSIKTKILTGIIEYIQN